MRSQQTEDNAAWSDSRYLFQYETTKGPPSQRQKASNSLSGKESNELFLAHNGNFIRVSQVSGADSRQDGRGFALLDYNTDGWIDMLQVNLTEPRVRLLKNELHKVYPDRKSLSLQLVGSKSNRDAIGAVVLAEFSDQTTQKYHVQTGRGFAAQSSRRIHLTSPVNTTISAISILWPSGQKTIHTPDPSKGGLMIINESEGVRSEN